MFFIGLVSLPLIIAIFALGVADYLGVAIAGLDPLATALIVIVLATVTACFNIRTNAWVTGAFLFVEMAALVLLAVLGLVHVERPITDLLDPQALDFATGELAPLGIAGLVLAVTQGIFSYNGYGGAVYFAEETKNAQARHRPRGALERDHHRHRRAGAADRRAARGDLARGALRCRTARRDIPRRTRR